MSRIGARARRADLVLELEIANERADAATRRRDQLAAENRRLVAELNEAREALAGNARCATCGGAPSRRALDMIAAITSGVRS